MIPKGICTLKNVHLVKYGLQTKHTIATYCQIPIDREKATLMKWKAKYISGLVKAQERLKVGER